MAKKDDQQGLNKASGYFESLDDIQPSTSLALSDADFNRILMDVAPDLDTFLSPQSFGDEYLLAEKTSNRFIEIN